MAYITLCIFINKWSFFLELSKRHLAKVLTTDFGIYLCSHRITSTPVYLPHEPKRLLAAIYHVSLREQIGSQHNAMLSCNAFRYATLSLYIVYS